MRTRSPYFPLHSFFLAHFKIAYPNTIKSLEKCAGCVPFTGACTLFKSAYALCLDVNKIIYFIANNLNGIAI